MKLRSQCLPGLIAIALTISYGFPILTCAAESDKSSSHQQDYSKQSKPPKDPVTPADVATANQENLPDSPKLSACGTLGAAKVMSSGGEITVSTGMIERKWRWTGRGLVTVGLRDISTGRELALAPKRSCDWELPGVLNDDSRGILIDSECRISDDDGFVSKHLEVATTVRYPQAHLEIRHIAWAFPGVPGIRTQLQVKALPGYKPDSTAFDDSTFNSSGGTIAKAGARCDFLPLDFSVKNARHYWGMFNDPGNRLDQSKPMLKEERISGWPLFQDESINWAAGEAVEYANDGVAVVKESHKAVNNAGHFTGGFFSGQDGLSVTGWGLAPEEFVTDRFRECWATWTVVYQGGNDGLQLALKRFHLARYPVFPQRDALLIANTWGPGAPDGGVFSNEDHCLKEIPILADLGIEVLQIDAGWHAPDWASNTDFSKIDLARFPNGWKTIQDACIQSGIRQGLWFHAKHAKEADLLKTTGDLRIASWKLDFEHISCRGDLENRFAQLRRMMKADWMKTQFSLCPEYEDPRFGWYFAQEYGSIYFQNNQEALPIHLTTVPYQVLRQHWLMAKYFPLNKLQVMMQNPKRMIASRSDGPQHGHGYSFATGLACGAPVFFQSGQSLDDAGREELKALFAAYKQARPDMITSIVLPIGAEPSNDSWTGFQMLSTTREASGHLLVFRELHNERSAVAIQLKFLADKALTLTNLLTGESSETHVDSGGNIEITMDKPADYRLLRYVVKD